MIQNVENGIMGRMWRVVRFLCVNHKRSSHLKGKSPKFFRTNQGVAQGCTLFSTLFLFIPLIYCVRLRNAHSYSVGGKFSKNTVSSPLFAMVL